MKKKLFPTRRPEPGVGQASACHAPACHAPRAFTLVELLVVIGIIGLLAGLLTPAVMRALASSRNAAIKAEIDMLHMAIMNYKNEYGSFPPCVSGIGAGSSAAKHILRAFPRSAPNIALQATAPVTPANAIVGWLSGYTDDPTNPVTGGKRNKLFDFDSSRISSGEYHPSGKPNSPYIYIRSGTNPADGYGQITSGVSGAVYGSYKPQVQITASGTACFNPDTFQILCAGRDEIWDEDCNLNGVLDSGEDLNRNNQLDRSEDDLSNFWPGTRQDYLDSLK
jgi:prepilin-type N-terminal cleavage/methylation domain-containing protein